MTNYGLYDTNARLLKGRSIPNDTTIVPIIDREGVSLYLSFTTVDVILGVGIDTQSVGERLERRIYLEIQPWRDTWNSASSIMADISSFYSRAKTALECLGYSVMILPNNLHLDTTLLSKLQTIASNYLKRSQITDQRKSAVSNSDVSKMEGAIFNIDLRRYLGGRFAAEDTQIICLSDDFYLSIKFMVFLIRVFFPNLSNRTFGLAISSFESADIIVVDSTRRPHIDLIHSVIVDEKSEYYMEFNEVLLNFNINEALQNRQTKPLVRKLLEAEYEQKHHLQNTSNDNMEQDAILTLKKSDKVSSKNKKSHSSHQESSIKPKSSFNSSNVKHTHKWIFYIIFAIVGLILIIIGIFVVLNIFGSIHIPFDILTNINTTAENITNPSIIPDNITDTNLTAENITNPSINPDNITDANLTAENVTNPSSNPDNITDTNLTAENVTNPS